MKTVFKVLFISILSLGIVACGKKDNKSDEAKPATEANVNDQSHDGHNHANPNHQADPNQIKLNTPPKKDVQPAGNAKFEFYEKEWSFGKIDQGDVVEHVYKFKNVGTEPLIIYSAKASCGCTVPKKPTNAIQPGEEGEIQVKFNSRGKKGSQNKRVTIQANTTPKVSYVSLKGEVIAKPKPATDDKK